MTSELLQHFSVEHLKILYDKCLIDPNDICLLHYLATFEELNKFLRLLGTVFGFVSKDVEERIEVIHSLMRNSADGKHYLTADTMVTYETSNHLLQKPHFTSGTLTMLKLHRGMEFLVGFLEKLTVLRDDDSTAIVGKEVYELTLGTHHTAGVRRIVKIALYGLPTKKNLLIKVCISPEDIHHTLTVLPEAVKVAHVVYDRAHNIFSEHDIFSLP